GGTDSHVALHASMPTTENATRHTRNFPCYESGANRDLHSFPTRRSSDLCFDYLRDEIVVLLTPECLAVNHNDAREDVQAFGRCKDRKSTRLNSSHDQSSYAVFCLKKKSRPITASFERPPLRQTPAAACPP